MFNEAIMEYKNSSIIDNSTKEEPKKIIRRIMVEPSLQGKLGQVLFDDFVDYKKISTTMNISPIRKTMVTCNSDEV